MPLPFIALRLLFCVILCALSPLAAAAEPPLGTELGKISRTVRKFLLDPARPRIYATTSVNTVIAINTITRSIAAEVNIGSMPEGLDISPDGTRLYVANSGSTAQGVGIVDLETFTKVGALPTPSFTATVAAGLNNRLYVVNNSDRRIVQMSAIDGEVEVVFGADAFVYESILALSPDRKTLFHGNRGLSSAILARYDVSGAAPQTLQINSRDLGGNGRSIALNRAGTHLCYSSGSGQGNYGIALIPTGDIFKTEGLFNCGAYPGAGTFSADGTTFYTTPSTQNAVLAFNTETFRQTGSFPIGPIYSPWIFVADLATSHRGNHLYVATGADVIIYSTGIAPPLQITSAATVEALQDEVFSFQVTSTLSGLTFSATGLPPGLEISAEGQISGKPSVAGEFEIQVQASDPLGIASQNLTLTVLTPFTVTVKGDGAVTAGNEGVTWRKLGSAYSITATPAEGFGFAGWSGSVVSASATISGTVQEKMAVAATFQPTTTVEVTIAGDGEVTAGFAGITQRMVGSNLNITATPAAGWRFAGWSGSVASAESTLVVTVEAGLKLLATFEQSPFTPVTITLSGPGSVTEGLAGTTEQQIGATLAVEAMPATGARFAGWSGWIESTQPQLTFSVAPFMTLVANFESMAPYAGTYRLGAGLEAAPELWTSAIIQLGASGTFSATVMLDGVSHAITGDFLSAEGFMASIPRGEGRAPAQLNLVLVGEGGTPRITGAIDPGSGPVALLGARVAKYMGGAGAAEAGRYTWGAPAPEGNGLPGGAAFGNAAVTAAGRVRLTGVLGDGTQFACSSVLLEGGFAAIDRPLYGRKGTLNGILQFRDVPGQSDFDGQFGWTRSAGPRALFAEGFRTELELVGSRVVTVRPRENLVPGSTAKLVAGPFAADVAVLPFNRLLGAGVDPLGLRLELDTASHIFSGTFLAPPNKVRKNFRGRYLTKPATAFGQYRHGKEFHEVRLLVP